MSRLVNRVRDYETEGSVDDESPNFAAEATNAGRQLFETVQRTEPRRDRVDLPNRRSGSAVRATSRAEWASQRTGACEPCLDQCASTHTRRVDRILPDQSVEALGDTHPTQTRFGCFASL